MNEPNIDLSIPKLDYDLMMNQVAQIAGKVGEVSVDPKEHTVDGVKFEEIKPYTDLKCQHIREIHRLQAKIAKQRARIHKLENENYELKDGSAFYREVRTRVELVLNQMNDAIGKVLVVQDNEYLQKWVERNSR